MKLDVNRKAGLLYILPVLAILASWIILLYIISPPVVKPMETLLYLFTERPQLMWFRWFLVLPLLCVILAAAYFSGLARQKWPAILLLITGIALTLVSWMSFDWWIALTTTLPLPFCYDSVRSHFVPGSPLTPRNPAGN